MIGNQPPALAQQLSPVLLVEGPVPRQVRPGLLEIGSRLIQSQRQASQFMTDQQRQLPLLGSSLPKLRIRVEQPGTPQQEQRAVFGEQGRDLQPLRQLARGCRTRRQQQMPT
jgi:hypothetical protein